MPFVDVYPAYASTEHCEYRLLFNPFHFLPYLNWVSWHLWASNLCDFVEAGDDDLSWRRMRRGCVCVYYCGWSARLRIRDEERITMRQQG